ncbi:MAG: hypothetical protein RL518_1856 [Pseudomonadota bacterium]|jgi:hypothetical protein
MDDLQEATLCAWCGERQPASGHEHCSVDCYHKAHDISTLYTMALNDRKILRRTREKLTEQIAELKDSMQRNGPSGPSLHPEVQGSVDRMIAEIEQITTEIIRITERIAQLEQFVR